MDYLAKIDLIIAMIKSNTIVFSDDLPMCVNAFLEMGELLEAKDRKIDLDNKVEFLIDNPMFLDMDCSNEDILYYGNTSCETTYGVFDRSLLLCFV